MADPDLNNPALIEIDRQIAETNAERIVLEASKSNPETTAIRQVRAKLAALNHKRHALLKTDDDPEDIL